MKLEFPCALDKLSARQPKDKRRESLLLCCLLCSSEVLVDVLCQEQRTGQDLLQYPQKLQCWALLQEKGLLASAQNFRLLWGAEGKLRGQWKYQGPQKSSEKQE